MTKELNELTAEELGKLFPINIVGYKPEWKDLYHLEEQKIREAIGKNIFKIQHIGSTAVPGLSAKPTIDILVEIYEETNNELLISNLKETGYQYTQKPENPPPHMMFMKGYTPEGLTGQTYHIHVRYPCDWDEPVFRDYLIKNPEKAREYENLKKKLAEKYRNDREEYTNKKTNFIKETMTEARNGKTAIVFGSTGLVGRELVNELLLQSGFNKIKAVARREVPVSDPRLEIILLENYSQLTEFKDKLNADIYFCCIGTTIKIAGTKEKFRQVDLEIPERIALLAESLSVPNLVIISSIGASDHSSNFYLKIKGEMEKSVREVYKGNLKIVRPSLLMGNREEFRFGEKVSIVFMNMFGRLFAGPLKKYKGIKARDVAKAMIKAVQFPAEKVIFDSGELQDLVK
ncbi:MAG: hypothetical protein A2V64_00845 [Bacteroidetes bacterium RBG_13_43_22]|nr:MAG: hypothetical protein A2V64_00845 [Bacteroidetes bacterium RBG_13_43_22]